MSAKNGKAVILRDDENKAEMLQRAFREVQPQVGVQWECKSIVYGDPADVVEEFCELVGGDVPEWMEFDALLLDVHWGKGHPMGGFEIYDSLRSRFGREINVSARKRLPWRLPPVLSTWYAGNANNDPNLKEVYQKAINAAIPKDNVMQMVLYDDAVRIATRVSKML